MPAAAASWGNLFAACLLAVSACSLSQRVMLMDLPDTRSPNTSMPRTILLLCRRSDCRLCLARNSVDALSRSPAVLVGHRTWYGAHPGGVGMMHGPWDGSWWGFGMPLLWLLFLALIVVGVVLLVRSFSRGGRTQHQPDTNGALQILAERLARGELDPDEYQQRRRVLLEGR